MSKTLENASVPPGLWRTFIIAAGVIVGLILVNFVVRFVADQQPASISDIPLYPRASSVEYAADPGYRVGGASNCARLSFLSPDSEKAVQDYYMITLIDSSNILKREWVGDGLFYPQTLSVRFYRKASGIMQQAEVMATSDGKETSVTIRLCDLP